MRWAELTELLNADATGDTKTVEKWRKVWSDLKNNTKKKAARIYRAAGGTGGGPALNTKLSDLDQKVLSIMGVQAATGLINIPEIGIEVEVTLPPPEESPSILHLPSQLQEEESVFIMENWNRPRSSPHPSTAVLRPLSEDGETGLARDEALDERSLPCHSNASAQPQLPTNVRQQSTENSTPLPRTPHRRRLGRILQDAPSPSRRRTRTQPQSDLARQAFMRSDCEWRAFRKETERERVRLREAELRQQERWADLFKQFLVLGNRIVNILEKK